MAQTSRKPSMPNLGGSIAADSKRGGLGRGLASLIPTGDQKPRLGNGAADIILGGAGRSNKSATKPPKDSSPKVDNKRHSDETAPSVSSEKLEPTNEFGATYQELSVKQIRPNAKQPRSVFDEDALAELVHSVREFGVMQPIVVRYSPDGKTDYELIMGERRLRATKDAGLDRIPAIIRQTDDSSMLRDALLENIHRAELNPLEEAAAYQQLLEEFGVTQGQLAERLGRSRPLITNMIRLLQLPVNVQRRVAAGVLSAGHARALLGVKVGGEAQEKLALRIVAEGLSVRATEEAVSALNREGNAPEKKKKARGSMPLPPAVKAWAEGFGDALETKVSVQMGAKKGKIVVEFGGPDDFDRIKEILNYSEE